MRGPLPEEVELPEESQGKDAEFRVCLRCGKIVAEGDSYCSSCGSDLRASPSGMPGAVDAEAFLQSRLGAVGRAGGGVEIGMERPLAGTASGPVVGSGPIPAPPALPSGAWVPLSGPYHPYPYPYPVTHYYVARNDDMAVFSLVCAVLSFTFLPLILAIVAIVIGFMSLARINDSGGALKGRGFALAGIIVGFANLVIFALLIIFLVINASTSPFSF